MIRKKLKQKRRHVGVSSSKQKPSYYATVQSINIDGTASCNYSSTGYDSDDSIIGVFSMNNMGSFEFCMTGSRCKVLLEHLIEVI